MKNVFGLLLMLLFNFGVAAQTININSVADVARQVKINEMLDADNQFIPFSELARSPFLNDEFVQGQVFVKTTDKVFPALLRYHIFDDKFEVKKSPTEEAYFDLNRDPQIDVVLQGKRFEILENLPINIRGTNSGYGLVMVKEGSDKASLYKRISQTYVHGTPDEGLYKKGKKPTLEDHEDYFVKIEGKFYHIKSDKKEAPQSFPNHQKELKTYIKNNKLKFRKKTMDDDITQLVNYYNIL